MSSHTPSPHGKTDLPRVEKCCLICRLPRDETNRLYVISVAGIIHKNGDGVHWQKLLAMIRSVPEFRNAGPSKHERLHLVPEPNNPNLANSIKLLRGNRWEQVRYIPASEAVDFSHAVPAGCCVLARLLGIFSGVADRPTLGARVRVEHAAPGFVKGKSLARNTGMV